MKNLKRILTFLVVPFAALAISVPGGIFNNEKTTVFAETNEHTHSNMTAWTSTNSLPTSAGNYYLTNDVVLSSAWQAPGGTTNLCLNGHYVKQTGNASVMRANSSNITLNLYDCGSDVHYYYVDNSTNLGVVVESEEQAIAGNSEKYGSFTGGYLTGGQGTNHLNIAPCGGAMYMTGGAKVSFENVNFVGNNATFGGCIHSSNSTLTLKGGTFVGNTGNGSVTNADGNGVAYATDLYATHNQSGFRADLNDFTIGGKIEIFGNTNYDLERCSSTKVFKIGSTLENTHPMAVSYTFNTPFTSGLSGKGDANNFTSASADYIVKLDGSGEAYLSPAPLATVNVGGTENEYSDLNSAVDAWVDGSTLKLCKDVTGSLKITSGTKTLDLNNHVLKNTTFIVVIEGEDANLTITDNHPNKTRHYYEINREGPASLSDTVTENYFDGGYITGITNGGERAIQINSGKLVLSGGTVFGNRGGGGPAIAVSGANSYLVIEKNGAVIGNYQYADYGSGGAIVSSGTMVMTGGSVRHNSARLGVGGIRITSGSFTMTSGEIYGNYCHTWIPSGVYFDGTASANFGGSAKVYDNYYLNVPKDIGICEGDNFINICEPLTDDANLNICPSNDQVGTHTQTNNPTIMTTNWSNMMGDKDPYKYVKCNPIYSRDAKTLLGNYEVFLKDGEVAVGRVEYTVSFDANGGSGTMTEVNLTTRNYILPTNAFVAPNKYKFIGWKISGQDTLYNPGDEIIISENTTIVAEWERVPVVSFDSNGGSGTMEDIVLSDSTTFIIPENGFTAPNKYKFIGWKISGDDTMYQPGNEITVIEDITLVAQWEYIPTVSFDANGGSGTMEDVDLSDSTTFVIPENGFTAPNKYKFIGWKISGDDTMYQPGNEITVIEDITLVAQWEYIPTVSFDSNGGSGTMEGIVLSDSTTFTVPENGFTAPKKYKFIGWKISGDDTMYQPGDEITTPEDITLVAQWEYIPTVSFDANGGSGTMEDVDLSDSTTFVIPENCFTAPSGMQFIGWKLLEGGVFYTPGDTATFEKDTKLVAQWSPIPDQSWTNLNGKVHEEGTITPVVRALVKVLKGNIVLESTITNDEGEYHLDCPNGVYNLVIEYNELIETVLVEVSGNTNKDIEVSNGKTQSLVNISGEEGIAVGGLQQLARDIRTSEAIPDSKSLTLSMNIEQRTIENIENTDKFSELAKNQSLKFYDIKVEKNIDGTKTNLETTQDVLEIVIPYEKINKRDVSVYSCHNGELRVFEQANSKLDGTFSLDLDNGLVKIYTSKFSTFAIGYTPHYRLNIDLSFVNYDGKVNVTLQNDKGEAVYTLNDVSTNSVYFEDVAMGEYKVVVSWKDGEITTTLVFNLKVSPDGAVLTPVSSN